MSIFGKMQNDSGIIRAVAAAQRLDSRGKPTVNVTITTDKGD